MVRAVKRAISLHQPALTARNGCRQRTSSTLWKVAFAARVWGQL